MVKHLKNVISVSENVPIALRADRILVLDKGQIIHDGTPEYILGHFGLFAGLAKEGSEGEKLLMVIIFQKLRKGNLLLGSNGVVRLVCSPKHSDGEFIPSSTRRHNSASESTRNTI